MMRDRQFEVRRWQRFLALACVGLALLFAGLESVHTHADAKLVSSSAPCAICISIHSNSPAVTLHLLPTLLPVQVVPAVREAEGEGIAEELQLFIRPPPAV
jgi:hypothetical protein